ncbi:MAG: SIS domain-containing protein [Patescibacteria group bacterium]|nr:SIS domain-containing protein [Patescibacteria group bacterium]
MQHYIKEYLEREIEMLRNLPHEEIAKAIDVLHACYERDGRIYIFGNGGSLAIATHWVSDFNKTVFSHNLKHSARRFQAIRVPTTESELTAWANDVGYDMVFAGPLQNYLQDSDVVVAISSSGNSENIIKAVELAKSRKIPVIGLSGFDGGKLNELSDIKVLVSSSQGEYELVEGAHMVIFHLMTKYFKDYLDHASKKQ